MMRVPILLILIASAGGFLVSLSISGTAWGWKTQAAAGGAVLVKATPSPRIDSVRPEMAKDGEPAAPSVGDLAPADPAPDPAKPPTANPPGDATAKPPASVAPGRITSAPPTDAAGNRPTPRALAPPAGGLTASGAAATIGQ